MPPLGWDGSPSRPLLEEEGHGLGGDVLGKRRGRDGRHGLSLAHGAIDLGDGALAQLLDVRVRTLLPVLQVGLEPRERVEELPALGDGLVAVFDDNPAGDSLGTTVGTWFRESRRGDRVSLKRGDGEVEARRVWLYRAAAHIPIRARSLPSLTATPAERYRWA